MSRKARVLVFFAGFLLLAAPSARAAYDDVGVSARSAGLGGAFTAVADDAYAIYFNPAGLATLRRPEFATTYSKLLTGLSDNSSLQNSFFGYAHPLSGDRGTVGVAWNYFTLDSLYRESSVFLSYGRPLSAAFLPEGVFGGVNVKYLNRSLGEVGVASQPLGPTGAVVPGAVDPVLQHRSQGNADFDLGLLYRVAPGWTLGMDVQHLLEPNIAFSPSDRDFLGRNYKFGGAYRTPFTTLSADLDFAKAPDGSTDKTGVLAAEKWLPTLVHGAFGVRGSIGAGTRDYRQLGLGASYKIYRMQFDYGFSIPLGGLSGLTGTHRLGLTVRFGPAARPEPTIGEALLENIGVLAEVGTPEFRYELQDLALYKRTAAQEYLRQAQLSLVSGQFAAAAAAMDQVVSLRPADPKIGETHRRLSLAAAAYPEVKDFVMDPGQAAVYDGLLNYVSGNAASALAHFRYARSLQGASPKLESMIQAVSGAATAPAPTPAAPAISSATATPAISSATAAPQAPQTAEGKVIEGTMALLEVAMTQHDYDKVVALAQRVLELDPANSLAYRRLGVAEHALKKYPEALKALGSAYQLEKDPQEKVSLRTYMNAISALIARPKPAVRPAAGRACAAGPQDAQALYDAGVELYAEGKLSEAARRFKDILCFDPRNLPASRALKRVEAELYQSGERR